MSLLQPFILIISCDFQTTDSEVEKNSTSDEMVFYGQ